MIGDTKRNLSKRSTILIILILIALISNLVISKIVTQPSFNAETIKSLDEKKIAVIKLAAAAAASSTALTLIPGDVATPIANQMAELSKYFIIILSAILLEKMLMAVVGYVSFSYIIPIACVLAGIYLYTKTEVLKNLAIKLAIFGIVIFVAIPISIKASDLIYSTHQASVAETIEAVEENNAYIEENAEELPEEDKGIVGKIGNYLSDLTTKMGTGISGIIKKGENSFNSFLDAIAILIVTTCVIPVVVLFIFAWIIKILFGFDFNARVGSKLQKGLIKRSNNNYIL